MIDQPQHIGLFFDVTQSQDTGTPLCRHKLCPAKYCSHGALQSLDLHMQTQCQVGSDRRRVHHVLVKGNKDVYAREVAHDNQCHQMIHKLYHKVNMDIRIQK